MYNCVEKLTRALNGPNIIWTFKGKITESEAMVVQTFVGYHPSGYGFYRFKPGNVTTWECSVSSD
jgi:hypothetical protein